jgi:hypothetical protein
MGNTISKPVEKYFICIECYKKITTPDIGVKCNFCNSVLHAKCAALLCTDKQPAFICPQCKQESSLSSFA